MGEEDKRLNKDRETIRTLQKKTGGALGNQFEVEVLCTKPRALFHLAQSDYLPRQRELAKIEYNGMAVDMKYLTWGSESLAQTIDHTRKQIFDLAEGEEFKLGSAKKLAQLFFGEGYPHPDAGHAQAMADAYPGLVTYRGGKISYKPQAYTAKGAIQTTDGVFKSLVTRYKCPLANLILAHKKADKARNTFFANIEALALYFGDGKLHAGYGLTSTSTGRLASSVNIGGARFNAQNIPKGMIGALRNIQGDLVLDQHGVPVFEGVKCKKLFIPDDDSYCFGNADAKGAEVSIYAAYSHDAALIEALKSPAFYVGALGSKKNNDSRRERLAGFDLSAGEIAKLRGPVGLKIGSKTPPEIAIAILAEMTAVKNGAKIIETVEIPKATVAGCAVT